MLSITALKKEELPLLFKHLYDAKLDVEEQHISCQYKINPDDFFIAYKDKNLIGFIVALKQSDDFGFISTLIVLKEFRRLGYAKLILDFALEHLGQRQIALDCDFKYKKLYERVGFKSYFDLHKFLYITRTTSQSTKHFTFIDYAKCTSQNKHNPYIQCLLSNQDTSYKAILQDDIVASYGLSFKYKDGYKVVIDSNDYEEVKAIFSELIKEFDEGICIYIDATKLNPIFLNLANDFEMIEYTRFARMYNKVI